MRKQLARPLAYTIRSSVSSALALLLLTSGGPADAAEPPRARLDSMSRELRQLRTEVQALRAILAEIAELDRQRSALLAKALGMPEAGGSGRRTAEAARAPVLPPAPPPAARELEAAPSGAPSLGPPAETTLAPVAAAPPSPPPAPRRAAATAAATAAPAPVVHRRPPEVVVGSIRGKVAVPPGEPVAYVYVENVEEAAVHGKRVAIQQLGKKFVPEWAVVQRGTAIEFPNLDNIYHNVFSLSSGNSFDLGLYNSSADAKAHTFNEAGAVDIYCNIHPQMSASALVVPNRYFAKVKPDGSFEIKGVPRGKRKVVAWAPGARLTSQWVELEGELSEVTLKLEPKTMGHTNKQGRAYGSYE